ncbi:hypothetical protein AL047_02620 [Pseudomonas syringae pv. broussonetiae]|nr:hypothetical protein AL047_02620 [Pseudomonas syringae pv. broussonetiae]
MAHKVDEYCEVSKLQQCVELYAGLIEDWANIQSTAAAQHTKEPLIYSKTQLLPPDKSRPPER